MLSRDLIVMLNGLLLAAVLLAALGVMTPLPDISGALTTLAPSVRAAFACPFLLPPDCVEPLPGL